MLGNWGTGKLRMGRTPTRTRTMEITMATMGRLIKNFDMGLPPRSFRRKRLGVHLQARTHLLNTLGDDTFAGLESLGNNPLVADAVADFDRPDAHFVLFVHRCDLIPALQLRHGTLRYKQRILLQSDGCANFAVSAGTQNIFRIRK